MQGENMIPMPIAEKLTDAVLGAMPLAQRLFDDLARETADGVGVTRSSYGRGEQIAHDLVEAAARALDLEITKDAVGNIYMTLRGSNRSLPAWFVGSHLDSVLHGGNYDGAAGVIAGLSAIASLRRLNVVSERDITVMGIRAEESESWFAGYHGGHLGSRAALGLLWPGEIDSAVHVDTGKTLAQCMDDAGFESSHLRKNTAPHLKPERIHGYLELHIEQGPVLEQRGIPVGIVTGIRGCLRARNARTLGEYTHSGAVPHEQRRDAVLATTDFVHRIDRAWEDTRNAGRDMVYTVGKFCTDAGQHSITKVPGEVNFAFEVRSQDITVLEEMRGLVSALAKSIGELRNVTIDPGQISLARPTVMDSGFRSLMERGCTELSIPCMPIPSGSGHDAADFHNVGVPAAMIFVRNANGSHNANEAMEMEDFAVGTRLLAWTLVNAG